MAKEFDSAIELQLDIQRVSQSIQGEVVRILQRMERELLAEVASANYTEWRRARVERQLKEVRGLINGYYDRVLEASTESNTEVATTTGKAAVASIGAEAVLPTAQVFRSLASDLLIQGAPSADWWAKQSADTAFRFAQEVRQGVAAAETNQQIVRRVMRIMETSKAGAAALVHTSVSTIANDARMAVYADNLDVIKRYRAVATLDSHTCPRCYPLDGLEWEPDGTPIGHSTPMPKYPLHVGCRCVMAGRVFDRAPKGQRSSADGPVDADLTFSGWLKRQSKEKQTEILGKGRAELYQSGKITLTDLVNGRGSPLTLEQLRSKYA